jgi:uncharacterized protein (DUF1778 family)
MNDLSGNHGDPAMTAALRNRTRSRRDTTINLRASSQTRDTIDRAAAVAGKSRSEFILESAQSRAAEILLDQQRFELDDKRFKAFMGALEAPAKPSAQLRDLLAHKSPWET